MAELKGNKKRLTINLSFFTPNDHHQTIKNDTNTPSAKPSASTKSPKNFEEPNGVVGLGIVAALNNEMDQTHDPILSSKSSRNAIFAVSPRSSPIPIFSKGKEERLNSQEIEMSEEYTCVIKHIGKNVIKKRVYFDGELGSGPKRVFCAASPPVVMGKVFHSEDFLSYCYLCKKKLHGLDIFMYRFESQDEPLFIEATRFNSERSRLAQSFEYNYGDFIPLLRPFLRGYLTKCNDLQCRRLAFFNNNYVKMRRQIMAANGEKHKISCAMDHIIDAQIKGEISEENVLYIVENINVAAIETTLWSMEWAIAELVNHPTVQRKIRDEITAVLKGNPVTESNLHELPYLQAAVKETLRLHTPIPLLVPHMNLEEAKLGGYTIPKESKVVVNAWWLANNPAWWKNPNEFRPERFLEEEGETEAVAGGKVDFRFLPFGVGRRSCPGIILALPILGLVIAKLVMNFEMQVPPGMEKIDVSEKGGQFSLHIAKHSTVVFDPISA